MMILKKKIQETYNSRLRERYGDDPLTQPDFDPDLRSDHLVDPIKIESTGSPTRRLINYGRPVVSQPLVALHQDRVPS
jgi:hypothetical protein